MPRYSRHPYTGTERLSAYRIMWLMVFFDLPVLTKVQRKRASDFRKNLQKAGFSMLQYSVYMRHCASVESMEVHIRRVERHIPPEGKVSLLHVTDKQFGRIKHFWGREQAAIPHEGQQLELF